MTWSELESVRERRAMLDAIALLRRSEVSPPPMALRSNGNTTPAPGACRRSRDSFVCARCDSREESRHNGPRRSRRLLRGPTRDLISWRRVGLPPRLPPKAPF